MKCFKGFIARSMAPAHSCMQQAMVAINCLDWKPVEALLDAALPKNSIEHIQLLEIKQRDEIYRDINFVTESCYRGYTELVQVFLNSGFPPNHIFAYSWSMLHWATYGGHLPLVKVLLNFGADINSKSRFVQTPLYFSVHRGHLDVVKYLVSAGADINSCDIGSALCSTTYSCNNDTEEMLQLLLDFGADINVKDKYGYTALHKAVANGKLQSVKFLIEHGSLINAVSNDHETPLSISIQTRLFDIYKLLINSGADIDLSLRYGLLHKAIDTGVPVELIECLLEKGASVTSVYDPIYDHLTPLQFVIFKDWATSEHKNIIQIAKLLLIYGSDHYVEDEYGNTVLHWACKMGDVELVEYLIRYGLNVDAKNRYGEKPYDIAIEKGHTNIVKVIIHYHCNKYMNF